MRSGTYLVLTVHARLDLARLDEGHDLTLEVIDGPPESFAHALEPNRRERLEIQHECLAPNEVCQSVHVHRDMNVIVVARLRGYTEMRQ